MDRLVATFLKLVAILVFGPFLLCLAFRRLIEVLAFFLPWIILFAVIVGAAAGLTAGLTLRRHLPRNGGERLTPGPPLGGHRVRRPRGGMWR